jgi:hypothetical protein
MKPTPASPDQRVPSQSKTATVGASAWTAAWKPSVESVLGCSSARTFVRATIRLILQFYIAAGRLPRFTCVFTET